MSDIQSGCRQNHSCEDNPIRLEHDIRNAQATNTHVIEVFLDLTAACDKLWKQELLFFKKIGIKGRLLYWLTDFLISHKMKVKYAGE